MRSLAVLCYVFVLIASAAHAQDRQVWSEVDLLGAWQRVAFTVPIVARVNTRTRMPHLPLVATGLAADVVLPWHLTITGGYLFADLPARDNTIVHIPLVAATATVRWRRLIVADRNRIERLVGFGNSPVRYRNRLLVDQPVGRAGTWHLFADDEVFFDISASRWNQNRLQMGAGRRMRGGMSIDIFYLQRTTLGGGASTRALGTTIRIALSHGPT